jgi:hypothetical protein
MESSQTPPPSGTPISPAPRAAAGDDGKAGAGLRIGAVLLALALALIAAAAITIMVDVADRSVCSEPPKADELVGGYECYDFPGWAKPFVFGAGMVGGIVTALAALLALAFAIRGRGGRLLLIVTAAGLGLLVISVLFAQA